MRTRFKLGMGVCAALLLLGAQPCLALDVKRAEVKEFIAHMSEAYHFKKRALRKLLKSADSQPAIIDAMSKPAEKAKLWYEYRPIFLTERRIREGTDFWIAHRQALDRGQHQERRGAGISRGHSRRRDLLRPAHRQPTGCSMPSQRWLSTIRRARNSFATSSSNFCC